MVEVLFESSFYSRAGLNGVYTVISHIKTMIKGVTTEKIPSQKTLVRLERFLNRDCNKKKEKKKKFRK